MQIQLDKDPDSAELRADGSILLNAYNEARLDEELLLKQRAKINWLKEGDSNTRFFHNMVKGKRNRNRISIVKDNNGLIKEGDEVAAVFLAHYNAFLGKDEEV